MDEYGHRRDIWDDVYDVIYDPTPEINPINRRRVLNVMKKIRGDSPATLVMDTAVRLTIITFVLLPIAFYRSFRLQCMCIFCSSGFTVSNT